MKETERIKRINADLDKHFKSNKGAWWVSNGVYEPNIVHLHHGIGGERIDARRIALRILQQEPSVTIVESGTWAFTRETLRGAGFKI
jgi:hypothetical protein